MTTLVTYFIILLVLISFFWSGYFFRVWQETRIQKKVWSNIVKRIHFIHAPTHLEKEPPISEDFREFEVENLKNDLRIALLNEDYEEAAKIRDLINKLGL